MSLNLGLEVFVVVPFDISLGRVKSVKLRSMWMLSGRFWAFECREFDYWGVRGKGGEVGWR